MLIRDLMTPEPLTLEADETVDVAHMFMFFAHIRHLPVLRDGRVVGLVTSRDLLETAVNNASGEPVSNIMRKDVRVISVDDTVEHAIDLMIDHKYGCLPVVDDGHLVGIITEADFLKFTKRQILQGRA